MLKIPVQIANKQTMCFRDVDRLSGLPDELLLHIMSFLEARQAVKTCILSKRWKNLWSYLPCLNLHSPEFINQDKFIRFVNTLFSLRKTSQVDAFRLTWYCYTASMAHATKWILGVLDSRPRQLSIDAVGYGPLELPDSIFTCPSIETMDLRLRSNIPFQIRCESVDLVSLKRLNLRCVCLDGEYFEKLISGCPRLEELTMKRVYFLDRSDLTITSHVLKKLIIIDCEFPMRLVTLLSIPSLLSLHVTGKELVKIRLENPKSLVQAGIQFDSFNNRSSEVRRELLRGLSNATDLELIGGSKGLGVQGLLMKGLPTCPVFKNLKSLYLGRWCMSTKFLPIVRVVRHSPNLETLTLHHTEEPFHSRKYKNEADLAFVIECKHPKTVLIKCSDIDRRVKKLIGTLMANFGCLEKVDYECLISRALRI